MSLDDAGGIVVVNCDNQASVEAFNSGRARDRVIAACARAIWYLSAAMQVELQFKHVPGRDMTVPDALSRASANPYYNKLSAQIVYDLSLKPIKISHGLFTYMSFM